MTDSLRLWQLISPALPVGAFAWSGGLESAVDRGWVRDRASAADWIGGVLAHGLADNDLPLLLRLQQGWRKLSEGMEAEDRGDALARLGYDNRRLTALRETAELLAEDRHLGRALARLLTDLEIPEARLLSEAPLAPTTFAAAWALAASHWRIGVDESLRGYAFAWTENQVTAAVKLVPLGQTDGQRLLGDLLTVIDAAVERACSRADDDIGTSLPGLALASSWHETQYSRLFRS